MKRSTALIGCTVVAATLAATFQFAGELGGDAPAAGSSDATSAVVLSMLDGLVMADPDPSRPGYDRSAYQPSGWADLDGDCISGRHEILIAQSESPVQMDASGCFVETGAWTDPYTGTQVTAADEMTIDHVVPLSETHRAGAWRWDDTTKVAYANDETPGVLVAVTGSVNQSKADKTPDEWLPPRQEHHCAYASNWVTTKARWQLSVTQSEATELMRILSACDDGDLPSPTITDPPVVVLGPPSGPTTTATETAVPPAVGGVDIQLVRCQRREERVQLVNPTAGSISLAGYQIHDEESRHSTPLDQFGSLDAGASLVILTGDDAVASPGEVVWKQQNVWNNDGDTAYLVTPTGSITSVPC